MNPRKLGLLLFVLWALVFAAGALGELLDLETLSRWTDFKSIFLR